MKIYSAIFKFVWADGTVQEVSRKDYATESDRKIAVQKWAASNPRHTYTLLPARKCLVSCKYCKSEKCPHKAA